MTVLVIGGSGATGKLLVEQLLKLGHTVRLIIRASANIPASWNNNNNISLIKAEILKISKEEMATYIKDCNGVASCLGHNLTFKGMFGKPRRLVADSIKLLCSAVEINKPKEPMKFILMDTSGNVNKDLSEQVSLGHKIVLAVIRLLLPPHLDNEKAADFFRINIGQQNPFIKWVAVRPDSLIDENKVSDYEVYPSPIRSALFNPGKTSRINVANFMARLLDDVSLFDQWKGKMPVIYNKEVD